MKRNEGRIDRLIRVALGAVLLYLAFFSGSAAFASGIWHWLAIVVGIVMLVTAVTGFCPLYRVFGINTNK